MTAIGHIEESLRGRREMVLVGIDPSYKRAGIAVYANGTITVSECKTLANPNKSFETVYTEAKEQVNRVLTEISNILILNGVNEDIEVMSECPPPQGSFSPGLFGLDMLLFKEIQNEGWKIFRLYPTYIMHVHGKRDFKKSESVTIASEILKDYQVKMRTSRLSHDESEAVIFLARNMARVGVLSERLLKLYPALGHCKEVLL